MQKEKITEWRIAWNCKKEKKRKEKSKAWKIEIEKYANGKRKKILKTKKKQKISRK